MDDIEKGLAKTSLTALAWHLGDADAAERDYGEQLKYAENDNSLRGHFTQSVYLVNLGGVAITRLDWSTAESRLTRAHALAVANRFDYIRCSCLARLGFAKMMNGDAITGRRFVANGLAQSYRSHYKRIHQIAADAAAAALAEIECVQEAEAVLQAFARIRTSAQHERSPIEETLVSWIRDRMGPVQPRGDWLTLKPGQLIAAVADLLEPI